MAETDRTSKKNIVLIGAPAWGTDQPFHSLALVAGIIRDAGFFPAVHDFNIDFYNAVDSSDRTYWSDEHINAWAGKDLPRGLWDKYYDWIRRYLDTMLASTDPALVAFSVSFAVRHFSIWAAEQIKLSMPDIPVMFGGVDCFPREQNTAFLTQKVSGIRRLFTSNKPRYCDIICQGESEISLGKFLKEFEETGDWHTSVSGFAYYDTHGNLVNTGETELPSMLGNQPEPALDLFDLSKYVKKGSLPFSFSRGCAYNCNFCSEKPNFKHYRCREPEEAFDELKFLVKTARKYTDIPTINFSDSNFNVNIRKIEQFADLITRNGIRVNWGGQAHIQRNITLEHLQKLKQSGLTSIFWGIETGSQHVIDIMNKKYRATDARRILNDCNELGIYCVIPLIIGYPGETPEDFVDTVEMTLEFKDKKYCRINMPGLLIVRSNSPLYDRYAEFGLANNHGYAWETVDGKNTLPMRIGRRFIIRQAHGNSDLSMESLVDTTEIQSTNLNHEPLATDMFEVIHEMFERSSNLETFYTSMFSSSASGHRKPTNRLESQTRWLGSDKNSPQGREGVYKLILLALSSLRAKFRETRSPAPPQQARH